jgi:hypothetical protein
MVQHIKKLIKKPRRQYNKDRQHKKNKGYNYSWCSAALSTGCR